METVGIIGSGNAGATNVFRVMGWKAALIVLSIDIGKGIIATLLIPKMIWQPVSFDIITVQMLTGCGAIVGHIWTIFAGFKGGKGSPYTSLAYSLNISRRDLEVFLRRFACDWSSITMTASPCRYERLYH